MSLTEAGAAFNERCIRIAETVEEARLAATQLQQAPSGVLRVNAPLSYGVRHIAPVLPDFMARYPDLTVEMTVIDRRVDLIEEGLDLAIRIGRLEDSSLVARRLLTCRRMVVAAPTYLAAAPPIETPQDLANHNCLTYAYLNAGRTWRFSSDPGAHNGEFDLRVEGSLTSNNGDVLLDAVRAGLGLAWLPDFFCQEEIARGDLTVVLEEYEAEPIGVYAVFPHARHLSTKVRVFIDFLAELLPNRA